MKKFYCNETLMDNLHDHQTEAELERIFSAVVSQNWLKLDSNLGVIVKHFYYSLILKKGKLGSWFVALCLRTE